MKTLILSFPYASAAGGGERYTEQLVEGLSAKGFAFTLVSSSRALLDGFRRRGWDARPLWCGIEPVSKGSVALFPFTLPFFLPILAAVLVGFRIMGTRNVICLSLTEKLMATPIARLLGMRVFWMEHLVPGRSLAQNPYRRAYAAFSRLATVVTVSEAVTSGLAALGVSRSDVRIVPPGVIAPEARATLLGPPVIGIVSRLAEEKNLAVALHAFRIVRDRIPEATLDIFGDGPERASLEALAEELQLDGSARFHGRVEEREQLYRHLSALVVPSRKESFGIAALEAMSWGVPVIASRVEGLPETVEDEATGMLVDGDDASVWAVAILRVLTDKELAARMGTAARDRAANRFSLAKNLAAWEELLK